MAGYHRTTLALAVALVLVRLAPRSSASNHGGELNPTGDPVDGDPGYRDIKSPELAAATVGTRNELIAALGQARPGLAC